MSVRHLHRLVAILGTAGVTGLLAVVALGRGARMTVLYANGRPAHDPNQNSIVMRLDLGATSLLLTGDAESGPRLPPESPPGDAEAWMLANVRDLLDVDILQVAHHGSLTSSRLAFLQAVTPTLALIGSGPFEYGDDIRLPDVPVVRALEQVGARVLGTYEQVLGKHWSALVGVTSVPFFTFADADLERVKALAPK